MNLENTAIYIYVYGNNFSKNKEMNIWIEYEKGLSYSLPVVTDSHGGFGVLAIKYRCSGYPKTLGLDIVARDGWTQGGWYWLGLEWLQVNLFRWRIRGIRDPA
jgi:hypothetical protein